MLKMVQGEVLFPSAKRRKSIGSTVLETSTTGASTADQKYFAYGRQRDTGPVVTDHKFTGQKLDGTGLQ
jgi:hypothetical protein